MTPRRICCELLISTDRGQEYSNIALDRALKKYPELRPVDRRFISALYYGVIERRLTLDSIIKKYSTRPPEKMDLGVLEILRMGLYQIKYMDSVPESAAVNESVKLADTIKKPGAKGYINALLRSFLRDGCELPKSGVKYKDLSVKYSMPEWIVRLWERDYGEDMTEMLLEKSISHAPVTARFNTLRYSAEEIINTLSSDGITAEKVDAFTDSCYNLTGSMSLEELSAYKKGMLHIQDFSCQVCCEELSAKPGETVLDLCSAPGGKAFTIAEMMGDSGRVLAYDLHENRVRLIKSGAERLGLKSVMTGVNDAKIYSESIPMADRVLCDVPCSGLGVIRRKPEIKYRAEEDIKSLTATQYEILKTSSRYLKPGGTLIYSTCTLRRAENDEIVQRFLNENSDFEAVKLDNFTQDTVTLFPGEYPGDGFFIAKMRRKQ